MRRSCARFAGLLAPVRRATRNSSDSLRGPRSGCAAVFAPLFAWGPMAQSVRSAPARSSLPRRLRPRVWLRVKRRRAPAARWGRQEPRQSGGCLLRRPGFPASAPCASRTSRQHRSSCLHHTRRPYTCRRAGPLCSRGGGCLLHGGHRVNVCWYFIDTDDRQRVVAWIVARPQCERAGDHPDRNRRGENVSCFAAKFLRKTKIAKLGMGAKIRGHELSPLQIYSRAIVAGGPPAHCDHRHKNAISASATLVCGPNVC